MIWCFISEQIKYINHEKSTLSFLVILRANLQSIVGSDLSEFKAVFWLRRNLSIGCCSHRRWIWGKLDWSLSDWAGLELGLDANVGEDISYIGIALIGTIGRFQ